MSPSHTAFYQTAATVIPVFFLAYVVSTRTTLNRIAYWSFESVDRDERNRTKKAAQGRPLPSLLRWSVPGVERPTWWDMLMPTVYVSLPTILRLLVGGACVGLPGVGEYFALHAMIMERSTAVDEVFVWLGLATSAAVVLLPLLYSFTGLEVIACRRIVRALNDQRDSGQLSEEEYREKVERLETRYPFLADSFRDRGREQPPLSGGGPGNASST